MRRRFPLSSEAGVINLDGLVGALGLCSLLLITRAANAADERVQCPVKELGAEAVRIASAPAGWTAYTASAFVLTSVGFGFGPPALLNTAVPYSEARTKRGQEAVYKLDADSKEGNWLICRYGEHEELVLGQALPTKFRSCTTIYPHGVDGAAPKVDVYCRP